MQHGQNVKNKNKITHLPLSLLPASLASFPHRQPPKLIPSSGHLHVLFLLPGILFPQIIISGLLSSTLYLNVLPFWRKARFLFNSTLAAQFLPLPETVSLMYLCIISTTKIWNTGEQGLIHLVHWCISFFWHMCIPQYIFFLNKYLWIDEWCKERPVMEEGTNVMEESEMPSLKRCLVIEGWGEIQMVGAGSSGGDLEREQRREKGTRDLGRWSLCRVSKRERRESFTEHWESNLVEV